MHPSTHALASRLIAATDSDLAAHDAARRMAPSPAVAEHHRQCLDSLLNYRLVLMAAREHAALALRPQPSALRTPLAA